MGTERSQGCTDACTHGLPIEVTATARHCTRGLPIELTAPARRRHMQVSWYFSWLHFPFLRSFVGGRQKEKENPMFWKFLFSCSFSLFCGSFWKCQKEHQILGKLKEKEKLAKLLLFHADSLTLVKVDNQQETAANCYF